MALKVIGAGFGRTGTMSLKLALEALGLGRCYHMVEVFQTPGAPQAWTDAAEGKEVDWDAMFDGFGAAVDFPVCAFYRELAAHYPDAKVILTERDPESWFASTQATIFGQAIHDRLHAVPEFGRMITALFDRTFNGRVNDHDYTIAVYQRHNAQVRRDIPAERLLVYNPVQGWGPLCTFLGVPVPDTAFPHTNTREEFGQRAGQTAARLAEKRG